MNEIFFWALLLPAAMLGQALLIALVMVWASDREDDL